MCPDGVVICTYTYQYMITAHMLGCAVLVALTLALGVRPAFRNTSSANVVMLTGVMYIAAQIPVSVVRLHNASQLGFVLKDPVNTYINFLWSPMLTVVLLWLYISHMVSSCVSCDMDVPKENIDAEAKLPYAALAIIIGFFFNYVLYGMIVPAFCLDKLLILRVLFGTAIAIALLEIIYVRTRYNKVMLFNFTWFMYLGTWAYLIAKAS